MLLNAGGKEAPSVIISRPVHLHKAIINYKAIYVVQTIDMFMKMTCKGFELFEVLKWLDLITKIIHSDNEL